VTMMEPQPLQSKLPHSALTGLTKAREHALSELTNDAGVILPTVSHWDSNFVILSAPPEGELLVETWLDPEAVTDFYTSRILNRHHTLAQYRVNEVNAPWYQFTEQWGDLRWFATGGILTVHVAGLFPVWVDGILGEICWHEPAWATGPFGQAGQMELSRRLDAFDDGWRAGDVDAMLATVEDDSRSVIRVVDPGRPAGAVDPGRPAGAGDEGRSRWIAGSKDELHGAWSAPEFGRVIELERLHQCMKSWYVFASYRMLLQLPGRRVARETALLLPVGPNGKFVGELSYSMETEV
jgi:hypothetical protein